MIPVTHEDWRLHLVTLVVLTIGDLPTVCKGYDQAVQEHLFGLGYRSIYMTETSIRPFKRFRVAFNLLEKASYFQNLLVIVVNQS